MVQREIVARDLNVKGHFYLDQYFFKAKINKKCFKVTKIQIFSTGACREAN
jgi:hypothetical protein